MERRIRTDSWSAKRSGVGRWKRAALMKAELRGVMYLLSEKMDAAWALYACSWSGESTAVQNGDARRGGRSEEYLRATAWSR